MRYNELKKNIGLYHRILNLLVHKPSRPDHPQARLPGHVIDRNADVLNTNAYIDNLDAEEIVVREFIQFLHVHITLPKYHRWVVQRFACMYGIALLEDFDRANAALLLFDRMSGVRKDIGSFRTLTELETFVEPYREKMEEDKTDYYKTGEVKLIFENEDFKVLRINSEKAAQKYGRGTKWCISAVNSTNYYKSYRKISCIQFILDKKSDKKYAVLYSNMFEETEDFIKIIVGQISRQYDVYPNVSIMEEGAALYRYLTKADVQVAAELWSFLAVLRNDTQFNSSGRFFEMWNAEDERIFPPHPVRFGIERNNKVDIPENLMDVFSQSLPVWAKYLLGIQPSFEEGRSLYEDIQKLAIKLPNVASVFSIPQVNFSIIEEASKKVGLTEGRYLEAYMLSNLPFVVLNSPMMRRNPSVMEGLWQQARQATTEHFRSESPFSYYGGSWRRAMRYMKDLYQSYWNQVTRPLSEQNLDALGRFWQHYAVPTSSKSFKDYFFSFPKERR